MSADVRYEADKIVVSGDAQATCRNLSTSFGSCWKPVPVEGFEELYYVSRDGRIYSVASQKLLKVGLPTYEIILSNKGQKCQIRLAKLVYSAFVGYVKPYQIIGYKDGNPGNMDADNLFLMEGRSEQQMQEYVQEKKKETYAKKYGVIKGYGPNGEYYEARTFREMAEMSGIGRTSIGDICAGKRDSCKGWTFERMKPEPEGCAW